MSGGEAISAACSRWTPLRFQPSELNAERTKRQLSCVRLGRRSRDAKVQVGDVEYDHDRSAYVIYG